MGSLQDVATPCALTGPFLPGYPALRTRTPARRRPHRPLQDCAPHDHLVVAVLLRLKLHIDEGKDLLGVPGELAAQVGGEVEDNVCLHAAGKINTLCDTAPYGHSCSSSSRSRMSGLAGKTAVWAGGRQRTAHPVVPKLPLQALNAGKVALERGVGNVKVVCAQAAASDALPRAHTTRTGARVRLCHPAHLPPSWLAPPPTCDRRQQAQPCQHAPSKRQGGVESARSEHQQGSRVLGASPESCPPAKRVKQEWWTLHTAWTVPDRRCLPEPRCVHG